MYTRLKFGKHTLIIVFLLVSDCIYVRHELGLADLVSDTCTTRQVKSKTLKPGPTTARKREFEPYFRPKNKRRPMVQKETGICYLAANQ